MVVVVVFFWLLIAVGLWLLIAVGFFFLGWVLIELLARFDCGGGALVLIVGVERGRNGEEKRVK